MNEVFSRLKNTREFDFDITRYRIEEIPTLVRISSFMGSCNSIIQNINKFE